MNLESDKRLNIQLGLDFSSMPTGEARQGRREDIESLSAVNESERPANTSRVMEEVCERANLKEALRQAVVFGVVEDPTVKAYPSIIADLQAAALTLGLQLVIVNASSDSDVERAFASLSQQRVRAVLIGVSNLYLRRMEQLASLAARHALPTMFTYREFVLAGGLMSYGSSLGYAYHQVGTYTGRILKGEKPADLPVEQAMRLELTINLKTAKALGLTIPETLLATVDEVIQ